MDYLSRKKEDEIFQNVIYSYQARIFYLKDLIG